MIRRAAALLLALVIGVFPVLADAACRQYTNSSPSFVTEGEPAAACAAAIVTLQGLDAVNTVTQTSCTLVGTQLQMGVSWSNGFSTVLYMDDTGACTGGGATPPATGASAIVGTVVLQLPAFLDLSAEDGALIAAAIGGVWLLAWALRATRSALDTDGDSST